MNPVYDYVFVTHLPAFYKVNLYNALAKTCRVFVIFIASHSVIRTADFTVGELNFDYCILNQQPYEQRSKLCSLYKLVGKLKTLSYRKMVVGGWDLIEFWVLIGLSRKRKNALALESSIFESNLKGYRKWAKKLFLSRINTVFACGEPHRALLEKLHFKGEIKKTLGVGIFNYHPHQRHKDKCFSGKFLYVGRVAPEKNVEILLKIFNKLPDYTLTIIGQGPLSESLQKIAPANVNFQGHIANQELTSWYEQHDVFVLPSLKEPWGLVVEEAIYYGLPIIASQHVGCAQDLVQTLGVGVLFNPTSEHSLMAAILWTKEHYSALAKKAAEVSFTRRDNTQLQQYMEAIA